MNIFWIVMSILGLWQLWTISRCIVQLNNNMVKIGSQLLVDVEYDGAQHYEFVKKFHGTKRGFKVMQERDQVKNEYAEAQGIRLIRIRYDEDIIERLKEIG